MIQDFSWRNKKAIRPWYMAAINLIKNLPPRYTVLELGSGLGEFAQILKKRFNKIICADGEKYYFNHLKKEGFKVYNFDFNKSFPFKDESFDLVVTLEVIEHLVKPTNFISEIKRILRKNGYLLISTPNISWLGYRFFSLIGRPPIKTGYHFQFYNYFTLKKLFTSNGFKIFRTNSITPLPMLGRCLSKLKQAPFFLTVNIWQNFLAQDLILLAKK